VRDLSFEVVDRVCASASVGASAKNSAATKISDVKRVIPEL